MIPRRVNHVPCRYKDNVGRIGFGEQRNANQKTRSQRQPCIWLSVQSPIEIDNRFAEKLSINILCCERRETTTKDKQKDKNKHIKERATIGWIHRNVSLGDRLQMAEVFCD